MNAWTPGQEELAIILGFAREAELNTALIERIVPGARSGERKRKVAHIIACCEASLDALEDAAKHEKEPKPEPVTNREKIAAAIEEHAAAGVPNA